MIPTLAPSATLSPIVRLPASPIWAASRQCRPIGHIVADLDLIVDFGALADHGVAQAAAIDGGAGADLDVVLDQHPAGLGHLQMALRTEEHEAIAVLADAAAGMDQHIIADQGALDRRAGADIAVPADLDAGADHRAGPDHGARADLDARARSRASGSTITPSSRCAVGSMMADGAMPSLPSQDCGRSASPMQFAREQHKGAERLRGPQHRDMGGHAAPRSAG